MQEDFLLQKNAASKLEHEMGDDGRLVRRSQKNGNGRGGCANNSFPPGTGTGASRTAWDGEGGHGDEDEEDDEVPPWLKPEKRWAGPSWMDSRRPRLPRTYSEAGIGGGSGGSGGGSSAAAAESDVVPEMSAKFFPPPRLRRVSSGGGGGCYRGGQSRGDSRGAIGTSEMGDAWARGGEDRETEQRRQQRQQRQQLGQVGGTRGSEVELKKARRKIGRQEGHVHRAMVWDWQVRRGEATYTVEVEIFGQSEARIVFRR